MPQLAAGSWIATGPGPYAQLQVGGTTSTAPFGCANAFYPLTRGWNNGPVQGDSPYPNSPGLSFAVTNAHGDIQNFSYWTATVKSSTSSSFCATQQGFRLTSWTFPQGVTITLAYNPGTGMAGDGDPLPELASVSNNLGQSINFASSGLGGFSSGNSGDNRQVVVTPATDMSGIATHTDPVGDINTFVSTSFGNRYLLNSIYTADNPANATASNTPSTQYVYDSMQRVQLAYDAVALQQGSRGPYQLNIAEGLRGEHIDPLGARYTVYYDNRKRALEFIDELSRTTMMTHDGHLRVVSTTYPQGDQETFTYNNNNPLTLTKTPWASGAPQPASLLISAQWDPTWNKPSLITDANGNQTSFVYYASGTGASLLQSATLPAVKSKGVGNPVSPVWTYSYNAYGQPYTQTDPTGIVTQTSYDTTSGDATFGYLLSRVVDAGASPHLNLTTAYGGYDAYGDATQITDPNGHITTSAFDPDRRPSSVTAPPGVSPYTICTKTENTYTAGLLTQVRKSKVCNPSESDTTQVSDANWAVTLNTYTPTRKPWTSVDPNGDQTITAYDGDDRPSDTLQCLSPNSGSTPNGSCPGAGRDTHTTFYADGSPFQVFKGWGSPDQITYSSTAYDLDNNPLTVADANGNVSTRVYDGYERLYRLCLPDSTGSCTVSGSPGDFEQYAYDSNGNLLTRQKRDGKVLSATYDALNRSLSRVSPANASSQFQRTVSSNYDLASRLWDQTLLDTGTGHTSNQTMYYRYDSAGRLSSVDDGFLAAVFNSGCTLGSATPGSRCLGSVSQGLDAAGNLITQTLYGASGVPSYAETYAYDALNRFVTLSDSVTQASYAPYTPLGWPTSATWGNGSSTAWGFQDDGDLASLTQTVAQVANTWGLTHNGAHQITAETLSNNAFEMKASTTGLSFAVNSLNQYTTVNSTTQTYDKNGNLTGDGTWTYQYDEDNALRTATGPSTVQYDYDPSGRRRAKTVNGLVTYYTWDGAQEVAEWSSTGTLTTRYLNGVATDDHVAMLDYSSACASAPTTPCRAYYHPDWHGSTVLLSNQGNTAATSYHYGPYGEDPGDAATGNPFRYAGRRLDFETGLYYYRGRYYSSALGRFLQTDPIGDDDNINLYAYTGNDPLNNTDPTGTTAYDCSGGVGTGNCDANATVQAGDTVTVAGGTEYGYAGNGVVLNLTALSNIPGIGGIKDAFDLHNSVQDSGFSPEALSAASNFVLSTIGGKEGRIEGQAAKEIGEKVIQKAADEAEMIARKISGFTKHGLNQAISRDGVGVANTAILDAVKNPVKTVMQAEGKVKYVGKDATVVLNKDGKVISTWANNGNGVRGGGQ